MNPAPPQTSSFTARPPARSPRHGSCPDHPSTRGEVSGEPVAPVGHRQDVLALAGERRPGGPRRGPGDLRAGGLVDGALDVGLAEDLYGEVVPRDSAGAGLVDDPG